MPRCVRSLRSRSGGSLLRAGMALALGALALVPTGVLAASRPYWHPSGPFSPATNPASDETLSISHLFWVILGISGVLFLFVCSMVGVAIVRYSAKPDSPLPRQVFGNRKVELLWTGIPTVALLIAFIATVYDLKNINAAASSKIFNIYVTGHQWWWEFQYPSDDLRRIPGLHGVSQEIRTANEIHIPTGWWVHFHIRSADVIHSFWIPQLARQEDANPAQDNPVYMPPLTAPGVYDGDCYEYCGEAHAWMKFRAIVQTPGQFAAWARHQTQLAAKPTTALVKAGYQVFVHNTCVNCHNVYGTPAGAQIGPNLTHVGSRWTIGAGALPVSQTTLMDWVADPSQYKPGVNMPGYGTLLSQKQLKELAAYLFSLK